MSRPFDQKELFRFSEHVLNECMNAAATLKFDKADAQQLCVICLHGSVIELASGVLELSKLQQGAGIPILFRAMLEAFAKLRCCLNNPGHPKVMAAKFQAEKLRLLRTAQAEPENEFLSGIRRELDIDTEVRTIQDGLARLTAEGHGPVSTVAEFERAGLKAVYGSMYWNLCLHSHSNLSALQDRHLNVNGDSYEVAWFKEPEHDDVLRNLDSMCGAVITAAIDVHKLLDAETVPAMRRLQDELSQLRAIYTQ